MRIHTDTLTYADLYEATRQTNIAHHENDGYIYMLGEEHGSRKRMRAWEVALEGDGTKSKRRAGHTLADGGYAATWDQWGWFLAELFRRDPNATSTYYASEADFHAKTQGKFIIGED